MLHQLQKMKLENTALKMCKKASSAQETLTTSIGVFIHIHLTYATNLLRREGKF